MKNVTVYRCGTVIADGVKMVDGVHVDPPAAGELARVTFDITGTLTFSPDNYVPPCPVSPVHPDTDRVARVRAVIDALDRAAAITPTTWRKIQDALR